MCNERQNWRAVHIASSFEDFVVMPPDNATREVAPASAAVTAVTHTDHEYVMYTHAASGVAHTNASDPSDR